MRDFKINRSIEVDSEVLDAEFRQALFSSEAAVAGLLGGPGVAN